MRLVWKHDPDEHPRYEGSLPFLFDKDPHSGFTLFFLLLFLVRCISWRRVSCQATSFRKASSTRSLSFQVMLLTLVYPHSTCQHGPDNLGGRVPGFW